MAVLIAARRAQDGIPHAVACRALGVSRSWFYKHKDGELPPRAQRRERLKAEVARLFAVHEGKYGSPRIAADLRDAGWRVSENTVAALMAEQRLAARRKKKRKGMTRPGKGRWRAPDLVKRDFPATQINTKWYGDGTEIPTGKASSTSRPSWTWAHAGSWGSRWVSITTRSWPTARWRWPLRCAAGKCPGSSCTPTGAANTPPAPSARPGRLGIRQSIGRPGSALGNAVIESWHSTLEFELRPLEHFATRAAARARVPASIEDYNHHRRHSALQIVSPADYEKLLQAGEAA